MKTAGVARRVPSQRGRRATPLALAAHRLALAAASALPARRRGPRPAGWRRIAILVLDAAGTSGAVRASLNLAGELAARHDVELVSVDAVGLAAAARLASRAGGQRAVKAH